MTYAQRYDVVIVGAGSAGCVVAERLTRDAHRQVLLLERGGDTVREPRLSRLDVGEGSSTAQRYSTNIDGLTAVRGRGLGGSSAVNGGYFLRWHDSDLDLADSPWSPAQIEDAYRDVESAMSARPWLDEDLTDVARAFERYWSERAPVRNLHSRTPIVGLNRVVSNHLGAQRVSAFDGYLATAMRRENLAVARGVQVARILTDDAGAVGVLLDGGSSRVRADRIILCGGTLGTAELLFASGLADQPLPLVEHREVLVRYGRTQPQPLPPALLQTVVHTDSGCEIRCYSDDFARFIDGVPVTGPTIGIAAMMPGVAGTVHEHDGHLALDLGAADWREWESAPHIDAAISTVADMLKGPEFAEIVLAGSVSVDSHPSTSQHACATLPLGSGVDWRGQLADVAGLHVIDGSVLPHAGRSGPHATIMMVATLIADELAR